MIPTPDDQWIDHKPGDPMPVSKDTKVRIKFVNGTKGAGGWCVAGNWDWEEVGDHGVAAYRLTRGEEAPDHIADAGNVVAEPTEPAAGEREASFLAGLNTLSRQTGIGLNGNPVLYLREAEDEPFNFEADAESVLHFGGIRALTQPQPEGQQDAEALKRYRAVTHWIGADAWDGCSDCMERLRWAAHADMGREMTSDEIATTMQALYQQRAPANLFTNTVAALASQPPAAAALPHLFRRTDEDPAEYQEMMDAHGKATDADLSAERRAPAAPDADGLSMPPLNTLASILADGLTLNSGPIGSGKSVGGHSLGVCLARDSVDIDCIGLAQHIIAALASKTGE